MKKSPFALVKEQFNDKAGLVEAVRKLATDDMFTARVNEDKGLDHVSNKKLLRLHAVLSAVQSKFGSRAGLIDEVIKLANRGKDDGYRARLERFPTPRLFDMYSSAARRSGAKAPAEAGAAPKKAPAKKAAAKAKSAKS